MQASDSRACIPIYHHALPTSPGERTKSRFYLTWSSLVAQMVKNLPAMQKTQVQSLGQEDPLEKGMATHGYTL